MTLPDINTKIGSLIGDSGSIAYLAANRLIDINIWYQKIAGIILDSQDETDWDDSNRTDYPIKTVPLTVNRDYPIPATEKMLKFKNLGISYDGVNIYRATPIDSNQFSTQIVSTAADSTMNARVDSLFPKSSPGYDIKYGSIFIYPTPQVADVTAGGFMIAEWTRQPTEFTLADISNANVIPGFDDTFHAMLAYGPAFEYATAKQLPQLKAISEMLSDYEIRLRRQYSSKQGDRNNALASDYQTYK